MKSPLTFVKPPGDSERLIIPQEADNIKVNNLTNVVLHPPRALAQTSPRGEVDIDKVKILNDYYKNEQLCLELFAPDWKKREQAT